MEILQPLSVAVLMALGLALLPADKAAVLLGADYDFGYYRCYEGGYAGPDSERDWFFDYYRFHPDRCAVGAEEGDRAETEIFGWEERDLF